MLIARKEKRKEKRDIKKTMYVARTAAIEGGSKREKVMQRECNQCERKAFLKFGSWLIQRRRETNIKKGKTTKQREIRTCVQLRINKRIIP